MEAILNTIAERHLNNPVQSSESIVDKGKVNQVFQVLVDGTAYIFRLNSRDDALQTYLKEQYCIEQASSVGVLTSACYAVGTEGDYAYMILNYIEGTSIDGDDERAPEIYTRLGQYAKQFHQIKTNGYGLEVQEDGAGFFQTWQTAHQYRMDNAFGDRLLVDTEILTEAQFDLFKEKLTSMYDWEFEPHLCHGNLGTENTILTPDNQLYVIDWGNGVGGLAPHVDLADIIAWKSTRQHLSSFLAGYGMSEDELKAIQPQINYLLALQLLNIMHWSAVNGKVLLDEKFIKKSVVRIEEELLR